MESNVLKTLLAEFSTDDRSSDDLHSLSPLVWALSEDGDAAESITVNDAKIVGTGFLYIGSRLCTST